MTVIVIDNYDSFVHNLARYLTLAGTGTRVVRNDAFSVNDIAAMNPQAIIISPGPCTPKEAGISTEIIRQLGPAIPILGVCLGHQCIAEAYGGRTVRGRPVHGKASAVTHDGTGILAGLPSPLNAGRYHSLITEIPDDCGLRVQARTESGEIMAFAHERHPVHGVQFHPESILTEGGLELVKNFVKLTKEYRTAKAA